MSAKKSIVDLYLMTLKSDTKFEEKLICCFKNDKNLGSGSFCSKYITFNLTGELSYMTLTSDGKFEGKTDLWFGK